jgi:hypothetical protein
MLTRVQIGGIGEVVAQSKAEVRLSRSKGVYFGAIGSLDRISRL